MKRMMNRVLALLLVLAMSMSLLCVSASASGGAGGVDKLVTMAGDSYYTAEKVTLNTPIAQTVSQKVSDYDYYSFELADQGYVSIEFSKSTDTKKDRRIVTISSLEDVERPFYEETLYVSSLAGQEGAKVGLSAGTYFICIKNYDQKNSYQDTMTVHYTEATDWETEENNSLQTCDTISVNKQVNGTIMPIYGIGNDHDYYKFSVPKNGVLSVTFDVDKTAPADRSWFYTLLAADGKTKVLYDTSYKSNARSSETSRQIGVKAGEYYLEVKGSYPSIDPYHVKVNYTASELWEKEDNGSFETATPISLGQSMQGGNGPATDDEYFTFTLNAATKVKIDLNMPNGNGGNSNAFTLYDAAQSKLDYKGISGYASEKTVSGTYSLKAGTYFIGFRYYSKEVPYKLTLTKVLDANTITAANKTLTAKNAVQTFAIGAKVKGGAKLTYKSNNAKVQVNTAGKVTVAKGFVGTAKITITAAETSTYKMTTKTITVKVNAVAQPMTVKADKTSVKVKDAKKKAQTIKLTVAKAQGKVTYKSSNTKYATVSAKGVVTLKKGTPKGTYKVTVTAAGGGIYAKGSKTVSISVK